jgi:DNA-binding winged helix-turn-helix (wHTH) protein
MEPMNSRSVPLQFSKHDNSQSAPANPPARYVRFGAFELDIQRRELFRAGMRVALPRKVLEVLLVLIERPGDVVTRETLRARLWPPDLHVNYNANVNTAVNKLRQVLGDSTSQPTYVETIPRRGYVFIAKTEYSNHPSERVAAAETTVQFAESTSERFAESGRSLFEAARRSPWLAIGIAGLLAVGIIVGAIVAYMALHR